MVQSPFILGNYSCYRFTVLKKCVSPYFKIERETEKWSLHTYKYGSIARFLLIIQQFISMPLSLPLTGTNKSLKRLVVTYVRRIAIVCKQSYVSTPSSDMQTYPMSGVRKQFQEEETIHKFVELTLPNHLGLSCYIEEV